MTLGVMSRSVALVLALSSVSTSMGAEPQWRVFSNKHGWEVKIPKCWTEGGVEIAATEAAMVLFNPGRDCPPGLAQRQDWDFGVNMVQGVKGASPEARISTWADSYRRASRKFLTSERLVGGKVMKTIISLSDRTDSSERVLNFILETTCNSKGTSVFAHYVLPEKEKNLPIEKLKLPPLLEKMVDGFVCKKPGPA